MTSISSCESETVALTPAVQDCLKHRYLFIEVGLMAEDDPPTIVYCDSTAAVTLSHHDANHGRSKHILPKYFMIRDHIVLGNIDTVHVPGVDNTADLFTKQLPNPAFTLHSSVAQGEVEHFPPTVSARRR
jgi:hypothetical protein